MKWNVGRSFGAKQKNNQIVKNVNKTANKSREDEFEKAYQAFIEELKKQEQK